MVDKNIYLDVARELTQAYIKSRVTQDGELIVIILMTRLFFISGEMFQVMVNTPLTLELINNKRKILWTH